MTKRGNRESLSGIRTEWSGGLRFLSDEESARYAAIARRHIADTRPDIEQAELLPVRAVELDGDEMLLEYARHRQGIPLYRGPRLFIRMDASGELLALRTDWKPCRFEPGPEGGPPGRIGPEGDFSRLRCVYALDVSAARPFYVFPPRMYDRAGVEISRGEKLGPWEWIDLRGGGGPAKRSHPGPIRPLQGRLPVSDSRRPDPLEREELRRARSAALDYLLRCARPHAYRWAFLAGKEYSSFRAASGGFIHIRVYRLANGLPVLGACLDLYVERRSGRLAAVSDELHFRRVRRDRFAEALVKPACSEAEAWQKLSGQIRTLPYYALNGSNAQGNPQASLVWIEESEFVCDASTGRLLREEIVRP
ncbi:hypothetical protein [Saccharibacillus alkalitolerans]|uniref:DUF4901 domain-containing protein n=1 Tax=Saccharibacillus alkalitolerans TaxID=2705290 RepID=A0ABX0F242_9BACL|nr:hypothetical protein [Saccharibacillus alkalitolerans]NGZ74612.1 hypothetical protein [Saccharibacillus alkalitolerans]